MQWKKIIKIAIVAITIYISFVAIEFIVFSNSMQQVKHGRIEVDSATEAKIAKIVEDRKRHAKDSLKLTDSSAKR